MKEIDPWNLREWVQSTSEAWSQVVGGEGEPDGAFHWRPLSGLLVRRMGLIPLASTDRGETLFYAPRGALCTGSLFVEDGESEFFEYSMKFAEWLYRWLVGEEVTGPGASS